MSKVTQVTARYGRSVQPKPYESKEALLEAVLVADEGESVSQAEMQDTFMDLINRVHGALALREGVPVANKADEPAKKTPKPRAKKGEKKAAVVDEVPITGDMPNDPSDEVPVEGETVTEATGNAEEATVEVVSDQELQSAAAGAAAKHGAAKVKELMKEFDVTLLGRLGQKAREMFLTKLDKLGD